MRRWLRFRLRTLLIVLTVFCLALGWWVNRDWEQRRAINAIVDVGGVVFSAREEPSFYSFSTDEYSKHHGHFVIDGAYGGGLWDRFYKLIGQRPPVTVYSVECRGGGCTDRHMELLRTFPELRRLKAGSEAVTKEGFASLESLTRLENLNLVGDNLSDTGMQGLRNLSQLESIWLWAPQVTDEGLAHVVHLPKLKSLAIARAKITDASLDRLVGMPNLASVRIMHTAVTDAGIQRLKQARPKLEVWFW